MQSSQIQHFCKCGTTFNVSDELCTGCDSKSELHVIICSVSKKPQTKRALFSVPKGKLQHHLYCIPFLLPFHCSNLSEDAFCFFLVLVILGFAISSWKKTQEYQNQTLCSVVMSKRRSEHSVAQRSRKIFLPSLILIYTDLTKQTMYVFLHPV